MTLSLGPIYDSYRLSHDYTNVRVIPPEDSGQEKVGQHLDSPSYSRMLESIGVLLSNLRFGLRPQNLHAIRRKELFNAKKGIHIFIHDRDRVFYALSIRLCVHKHKFGSLSRPTTRQIRLLHAVLDTQWSERVKQGREIHKQVYRSSGIGGGTCCDGKRCGDKLRLAQLAAHVYGKAWEAIHPHQRFRPGTIERLAARLRGYH